MTRTLLPILALASLLVVVLSAPFALALDEADRLWLVGEQASAEGRPPRGGARPAARRPGGRCAPASRNERRHPRPLPRRGRARRGRGAAGPALAPSRRLKAAAPATQRVEARFWEAEALYRSRR